MGSYWIGQEKNYKTRPYIKMYCRVFLFAEMGGFEPPIPCGMPVFETGALNHSATSPYPVI